MAPKPAAASASPSAGSAAPGTGMSGQRVGALVAGGVGLAGVALGAAMGAMVLDRKGFIDAHCPGQRCDAEGKKALAEVQAPGIVSTVGFGVGLAGLAAAAVLWLTAPGAARPNSGSGKGGSDVTGTLEIGPTGAALGVKGAF